MAIGIDKCYVAPDERPEESVMNTTVSVGDELLDRGREYSSLREKSELVEEALKAFIRREAARHLADIGGPMPKRRPGANGVNKAF